jgi:hypothetical protein
MTDQVAGIAFDQQDAAPLALAGALARAADRLRLQGMPARRTF